MKCTYLLMFSQGSLKVEYRLIASTKEPAEIVRDFRRKRKNANVIGIYKLEACENWEEER